MEKQELLLVCEVFKVFLTEESYDLLTKMKINTSEFYMLPDTSKSVAKVKGNFKDNLDILESLKSLMIIAPRKLSLSSLVESTNVE